MATAVLAVAGVGLAALSQAGAGVGARVLISLVTAVVWCGLLLVALDAGPTSPAPRGVSTAGWWGLALVILAGLLVLGLSIRRVGRLGTHAVAPGGTLAPGLSGALATLDLAMHRKSRSHATMQGKSRTTRHL